MQKELSMTPRIQALLIGAAAIAIALLAVFEIIPAQFAPAFAVALMLSRRRSGCAPCLSGRSA
jgi:hypothetical protein